ncbi:Card1-like endonuclease domain-containing protein [Billgrantia gudaonensis]|uniref:Card1 endonuclease domain-containing protein n=1 Tax=Billgrantia gudaonensis TaxID=376427 RepID=A0A1G8ZLA3_9GAMM|nr:DUF1887 family CARF protein [Halomonas gudaonensis]SDK15394.1 protein of unknown function [Halomonas gudaonensis]
MPHLHVALVSERPEITLIPLLQLRPERVILVATRQRRPVAERLEILLGRELPVTTELRRIDDLPCHDPQLVHAFANELADELVRLQATTAELTVSYHLGDAPRLTALLFQHALQRCQADGIDVDLTAGALYRLGTGQDPQAFETLAIEPLLDCDLYLLANGYKRTQARSDHATWREAAESRRPLTRYLAHHADRLGELLAELAALVRGDSGQPVIVDDAAEGPVLDPDARYQRLSLPPAFPETDALSRLAEAGLIEWSNRSPRRLGFVSLLAAQYLSGQWLAEYVWLCARDAGMEAHCGAHLLDLSGRHNDAPAVLDVLALHHNQLLMIACPPFPARPSGGPCNALHDLHALTDHTAGLAGTRLLVSAGPLDTARQRANRLGAAVMEGNVLKRLPVRLVQWLETGCWP